MQISAQRSVRTKSQAHNTPAYPEHQSSDHPGFFLACLLREQTHREELIRLTRSADFRRKTEPLKAAIYSGASLLEKEICSSLKYVIQDGLLPFAHAHTTYFDQQVAA